MSVTTGQDTYNRPTRYLGQDYRFAPTFLRERDPINPSLSPDIRPPENNGYYPVSSFWTNTITGDIWALKWIRNSLANWVLISGPSGGNFAGLTLDAARGGFGNLFVAPSGAGTIQFITTDASMTFTGDNFNNNIAFSSLPVLNKLVFSPPAGVNVSPSASTINLTSSDATVTITGIAPNTLDFKSVGGGGGGGATKNLVPNTYAGAGVAPVAVPVTISKNGLDQIVFQNSGGMSISGDIASNTVYFNATPTLNLLRVYDTQGVPQYAVPSVSVGLDFASLIYEPVGGMDINANSGGTNRVKFFGGPAGAANRFLADDGNTATPALVGNLATLKVLGIGSTTTSVPGAVDEFKIKTPNCALFIVDSNIDYATHTTIQAAINAAAALGGNRTVFIRPGTYTENLTLASGVSLSAYVCDAFSENVTIKGKITAAMGGYVGISGVTLLTNNDYIITQSSGTLELKGCFLKFTNFTGLQLSGGTLWVNDCIGTTLSVAAGMWVMTAGADLKIYRSTFFNFITSQVVSTITDSFFAAAYSVFGSPISTTGGSTFGCGYCDFECGGGVDSITLALDGSGAESHTLTYCNLISETKACLALGALNSTLTKFCMLTTDAANAVTGAGEWRYSMTNFGGTTTGVSVTTQTAEESVGPRIQTLGGPQILSGSGSPHGIYTAPQGSLFLRTDGGSTSSRMYVNRNSGTLWTAVITSM